MLAVIVGPLIAIIIIGLIIYLRTGSAKKNAEPEKKSSRLLIHSINDDRCTGCDACVLVCPTDVLELRNNKSRVIRFDDCIQCEQCALVCPTNALVMHYKGTEPPPVLVADLDEYYQSNVKGLYLVGEVAGKPLVKNAVNLGRATVEHAIRNGLKPGAVRSNQPGVHAVDVVIVGSGPAGLSAAMACLQRGISYVVLEKDSFVASTIARYPKGKKVMAEPYDVRCVGLLPVWDATKDQTIAEWNRILVEVDIDIRLREVVEDIKFDGSKFVVKSDKRTYFGQKVVLGIGTRGKPRRLGVPGEDLTHVHSMLDDPDLYTGKTILVVGGGDSAVEAAIALAEPRLRNKVVLSYRGKQFNRVKARNRQDLDVAVEQQRVLLLLGSKISKFMERQTTIVLGDGREKNIPTDHAFVLIGGDPPIKWLESIGIAYVQRPHTFTRGPTDQLVEKLIGKQPDNNRPNQPIPIQIHKEEDESATVMHDTSAAMAKVREAFLKQQAEGGHVKRERAGLTIMVPKEKFLLHLPEKAQMEQGARKVSSMRKGAR